MNFTPISQLDVANLHRLAVLHQAVMHTLLSDLGLPMVRRYYEICQKDSSVIGLCAFSPPPRAGDGPGVTGWAIGSPHPEEVTAHLRQPLPWFAAQMLRLAFTRPGVMLQLAQSVLSAADENTLRPGQIELTYIGVSPLARGQGLGAALLKGFVEAAKAAGYKSVVLSVETDNPQAVSLYTKAGFKIIKTFKEGRFERHRMSFVF